MSSPENCEERNLPNGKFFPEIHRIGRRTKRGRSRSSLVGDGNGGLSPIRYDRRWKREMEDGLVDFGFWTCARLGDWARGTNTICWHTVPLTPVLSLSADSNELTGRFPKGAKVLCTEVLTWISVSDDSMRLSGACSG